MLYVLLTLIPHNSLHTIVSSSSSSSSSRSSSNNNNIVNYNNCYIYTVVCTCFCLLSVVMWLLCAKSLVQMCVRCPNVTG